MGKRRHDIERYLKGEMSSGEMHALEKEALNDPFLSEAMEGAQHTGTDSFLFDLKELRSSFKHRTTRRPKVISLWNWSLGIAAGLLLLAVSSVYIILQLDHQPKNEALASKQEATNASPAEQKVSADSAAQAKQQLSLNTPRQTLSRERENASVRKKELAKPSSESISGGLADERGGSAQIEAVAQTETVSREPQRIVEADLTEVPAEIITKKEIEPEAMANASAARDQKTAPLTSKIIRGRVTSEEDNAFIPGVNVIVKGTSQGTVTDSEGNYEIAVNEPNAKLLFAFIGFRNKEIEIGDKTGIDVVLKTDYTQLSEIVVTGSARRNSARAPMMELAEPAGGREAFQKYLREKMQYPKIAIEKKIEGNVTVQFTVEPDGLLKDFMVLKSIGHGCDEELIRLIKEGPAWIPTKRDRIAIADKVKVKLKFEMPDRR